MPKTPPPSPRPGPARRSLWIVSALLMIVSVAALAAVKPIKRRVKHDAGERRLTIFFTSAIQGTLEPCGCNSDPLGGLDRYAALVRSAQKQGPVLLVDGGNMLFSSDGIPAAKREAARLRAAFLAERLTALGLAASAWSPADMASGPKDIAPARLAANAKAPFLRPSKLHKVGDVTVGLLGLVDPDAAETFKLEAGDPVQAAVAEAKSLRAQGADVVIAVAAVDRPAARKLARQAAIDFLVLGVPSEAGLAQADAVGATFIVNAAAELQKAGRIDLVLRRRADGGWGALRDAGSAEAAETAEQELDKRAETLRAQIERWAAEEGTDSAFLDGKRAEHQALVAELSTRRAKKWAPPATESYFIHRLIPIRRALPQDQQVTQAMRKLDRAIGKINLASAVPPPKPEPGRPHYVGDASCGECHKQAAAFWKGTVHAHAWKTLVDGGKHEDLECVGCHATGYGQVGGSALGFTRGLQDVQCEVCHGPASQHVAEEGLEEPAAVRALTPESTCLQCHNEKHSDTFNYSAYLRDILGPGHGEARRAELGEGPTGGQLRRAAMAKARATGQAQAKGL